MATTHILALDLATKTGWAHSCGVSGVQDFSPRRGDSPGMRWLTFRAWLNRVLDFTPTDVIVYEQAHHRGGAATHVAHSLIGMTETVAAERGIEVTNRHTASIKKHALGKGRGDKEQLMAAAKVKWPSREIADHNEADALWLLDLVSSELVPAHPK
jgi:Holliday junction resolvasome RuvABC endonuclease subunit